MRAEKQALCFEALKKIMQLYLTLCYCTVTQELNTVWIQGTSLAFS